MALNQNMMHGNRDEWDFEYTARDLAVAALKQKEYRDSRVAWWTDQQAAIMAEIRSSGIEVQESVGAQYSHSSAATGPQVVVRNDLQKKLNECHAKIRAHSDASAEYDGWFQVLKANPESRLKLRIGDWLFFFGKP